MLYLKNGQWAFCPYKVKYKQRGKTLEAYTHDKGWWERFAEKWDHTEILSFEEVEYSAEQKTRLTEVADTPEGFEHYAGIYALKGKFPDELDEEERLVKHPFKELQLEKEDIFLGQSITETEINSILQGQSQSEAELRLMMLEMEAE